MRHINEAQNILSPAEVTQLAYASFGYDTMEASGLQWNNWGSFGSGFSTRMKLSNFGRDEDYLAEVKLRATDDQGNRWPADIYRFELRGEESRILSDNEELYIGKNKIIRADLLITDDRTFGRPKPNLNVDDVSLELRFSSSEVVKHRFKPSEVR